jgi:F-type H+-transporting ATPase subunit gamma
MSQLIKLREQITTIKTIQKITQAMRLVSMSVHSRLNNQKNYLKNYQNELNKITSITNNAITNVQTNNILQNITTSNSKIIILIGSQKGLCGSFNQDVLRKYSEYHKSQQKEQLELIAIGKKLIDTTERKYQINRKIIKFTPALISEIVNELFNHINQPKKFTEVLFFSNSSKNFFTHSTQITPLYESKLSSEPQTPSHTEPYIWEQPSNELAETLNTNQLKLTIYCLLFDSLIAEYSARFRSMDSATRNANTLLETAERQYRKVRQAKITRELVELSAIFQTK